MDAAVSFAGARSPVKAVVLGGFSAGLLDILYALASGAAKGHEPHVILQYITSGLVGSTAFAGGTPAALAGLALHFAMVLLIAAVFVIAAAKGPDAVCKNPWLSGPLFGAGVYFVMQQVVLPLSRVPLPSPPPPINFPDLAAHMFLVGLPIAFAGHHWAFRARSA
jgi:hypothetical protein